MGLAVEDIHLASAKALLTVAFTGGRPHRDRAGGLRVHRARVYALVLHSRLRDAGVFDCL